MTAKERRRLRHQRRQFRCRRYWQALFLAARMTMWEPAFDRRARLERTLQRLLGETP